LLLIDNGRLSGNHSLGSSSLSHDSVLDLEDQSQQESQGHQSQSDDGKVPGSVSSPSVSDGSIDGSIVVQTSSKDGGSQGHTSSESVSDGKSSVLTIGDGNAAVEASRVVDGARLDHSRGKDDDGRDEDSHGENGGDDHQQSSALHGGSVLVGSEVEEMDKDQPGDPANDHEGQDGVIDPLRVSVVLVDDVGSRAGTIDEAVGSIEEIRVPVEPRIVVEERVLVIVRSHSVIFGIPPRSAHGGNVEESCQVGDKESE